MMEQSDQLVSVSLNIGGRSYPVKVEESKIQSVKNIEKQLNEKIRNYELNYKDLDRIDSLTMTLITQSFELQQSAGNKLHLELSKKLDSLESLLDEVLG